MATPVNGPGASPAELADTSNPHPALIQPDGVGTSRHSLKRSMTATGAEQARRRTGTQLITTVAAKQSSSNAARSRPSTTRCPDAR